MSSPKSKVSRRQAIAALGASAVVGGAGLGCEQTPKPSRQKSIMPSSSTRIPTVYLPHGGGPWPFVDVFPKAQTQALADYLTTLPSRLTAPVKALLVVSAHWEEPRATLMTGANPPLLFDYQGFPPESYKLTWPAPGAPALATRVATLLEAAGIEHGTDAERGFDHGTFVPLKLAYPNAEIPTLQLSLIRGLDPTAHLALGQALAPLRDEGVLIIGSGMSFHNMQLFRSRSGRDEAAAFHVWLRQAVATAGSQRRASLTAWADAPHARLCHPREEHLLPLMVVAGAALDDDASTPFMNDVMGFPACAVHFG